MLGVIKLVNDSLHQPNIKGLPEELFPLGSLIYQETFLVLTIKSQSQASCQHSSIIFSFQAKTASYCPWMLTLVLSRYSPRQNSSKNAKFWFMTTIWSCVKLWRRKLGTNKIYCRQHQLPQNIPYPMFIHGVPKNWPLFGGRSLQTQFFPANFVIITKFQHI